MPGDLSKVFQLTSDFLKKRQDETGLWKVDEIKHNEPSLYQGSLITTSQCMLTLMYCQNKDTIVNMAKAAHYLYSRTLHDRDPIDLWAWKTHALKHVNTDLYRRTVKENQAFIAKEQTKHGYWSVFPKTFNLTNFSCMLALLDSEHSAELKRVSDWLCDNKAKDGFGWGHDDTSESSQITFTAIISMVLLGAGRDPLDPKLQEVRRYFEMTQNADGSWNSTKFTSGMPTTFATTVVLDVLMRLVDDPFDPKIKRGISFLVGSQNPDGSWPIVRGEDGRQFYPYLYIIKTLAFYKYLKDHWSNLENQVLVNSDIPKQVVVSHLAKEFEKYITNKFNYNIAKRVFESRFLGITKKAVERRKRILQILADHPALDVAEVIDELKKIKTYENLNKKTHLTQLKSDLEYLRSLNLVYLKNYKYYTTFDFNKL